MSRLDVFQVDAFCQDLFQGNPAGVVLGGDELDTDQMQALARELNNSETAFILAPRADDHEVFLRFFTPTTEVPSCGHATLAAHYVRAQNQRVKSGRVWQRNAVGRQPIDFVPEEDDLRVVMTQGPIDIEEPLDADTMARVQAAIGISDDQIDPRCPIQVVSTGHSKVMIGVRSVAVLGDLQPDLAALSQLSVEIGSNGYFVFTLETDDSSVFAESRMFAPAIGIAEDPVTGNGHGPLGVYAVHCGLAGHDGNRLRFKAHQGSFVGRPGEVQVEVDIDNGQPKGVRVSGRAVIVFRSEMEF
jgi:PhzF family phenazine biosynthesis protein